MPRKAAWLAADTAAVTTCVRSVTVDDGVGRREGFILPHATSWTRQPTHCITGMVVVVMKGDRSRSLVGSWHGSGGHLCRWRVRPRVLVGTHAVCCLGRAASYVN